MLQRTEAVFTMLLEIGADRAPDLALDLCVRIGKAPAKVAGQVAPGCGLATAWHANQNDGHCVQADPETGATSVVMFTAKVVPRPEGERVVMNKVPDEVSVNL